MRNYHLDTTRFLETNQHINIVANNDIFAIFTIFLGSVNRYDYRLYMSMIISEICNQQNNTLLLHMLTFIRPKNKFHEELINKILDHYNVVPDFTLSYIKKELDRNYKKYINSIINKNHIDLLDYIKSEIDFTAVDAYAKKAADNNSVNSLWWFSNNFRLQLETYEYICMQMIYLNNIVLLDYFAQANNINVPNIAQRALDKIDETPSILSINTIEHLKQKYQFQYDSLKLLYNSLAGWDTFMELSNADNLISYLFNSINTDLTKLFSAKDLAYDIDTYDDNYDFSDFGRTIRNMIYVFHNHKSKAVKKVLESFKDDNIIEFIIKMAIVAGNEWVVELYDKQYLINIIKKYKTTSFPFRAVINELKDENNIPYYSNIIEIFESL